MIHALSVNSYCSIFSSFVILTCISVGAVVGNTIYNEGVLSGSLTQVECNGTEEQLIDCLSVRSDVCVTADDADVVCQG